MRMRGSIQAWISTVFANYYYYYYYYRLSAQELLESPFLAIEPDVILLANDVTCEEGVIILQVVFKGSDRRAVKFDFNYVRIICMNRTIYD